MKKLLFVALVCMTLCACHVRHYHNANMLQVRVAMDHTPAAPAAQNDSLTNDEEEWEHDPLIETQEMMMDDEVDLEGSDDEALEELDRMMQGAAE